MLRRASKKSTANVINDPTKSLQNFDLLDLQQLGKIVRARLWWP
jgi:hypothetical protein